LKLKFKSLVKGKYLRLTFTALLRIRFKYIFQGQDIKLSLITVLKF